MAKLVQVKMMKRKYGESNFWCAYARGKNFGQFHDEGRAGEWMEHMVRAGFTAHPQSDIKPSGISTRHADVWWYDGHVAKIKDMIDNHPRKGKSIWEPHK